jgi:hypothetical protein
VFVARGETVLKAAKGKWFIASAPDKSFSPMSRAVIKMAQRRLPEALLTV